MASNLKWFDDYSKIRYNRLYYSGLISNSVLLDGTGAQQLWNDILTPSIAEIVSGDITKWLQSYTVYPFDITKNKTKMSLKFTNGIFSASVGTAQGYQLERKDLGGYWLGQYFLNLDPNDFTSYEPYKKFQVYLPFYGIADIKIADCIQKYINIILDWDYVSGMGVYYICVSENSINIPNAPYLYTLGESGTPIEDCRILSKYSFQLGTQIPISGTNLTDIVRNITMGAIKTGASIASTAIGLKMGANISTATTTKEINRVNTLKRKRKGDTRMKVYGKNVQRGEDTTTTTYDSSNRAKGRMVTDAFDGAVQALDNFNISPTSDKTNNPLIESLATNSVHFLLYYSNIQPVDENFNSIYGRPLGKTMRLQDLKGYTEISQLHIEGSAFAIATGDELTRLEQELTNGIFL